MQFKHVAASLLAIADLGAAVPLDSRQDDDTCPIVKTGDYVWKISNFSARKPTGDKSNSISFDVAPTNGAPADFTCFVSGDDLEYGKLYQCGENSSVWFAFQNDRSGLVLQQNVSNTYVSLSK